MTLQEIERLTNLLNEDLSFTEKEGVNRVIDQVQARAHIITALCELEIIKLHLIQEQFVNQITKSTTIC